MSRHPIKRDVGWKDHGTVSIHASVLGTLRGKVQSQQNPEAGGGRQRAVHRWSKVADRCARRTDVQGGQMRKAQMVIID